MRRLRLPLVLVLGALAITAIAKGQPPSGISRPSNETALSQVELGSQLYAGNCASCHGVAGRGIVSNTSHQGVGGIRGRGPSLRGVGAEAAYLYLTTGFMPLSNPGDRAEAQPADILAWTDGRALVATGSPSPDIERPDGTRRIAQANNVFIIGAAGLGGTGGGGTGLNGALGLSRNIHEVF